MKMKLTIISPEIFNNFTSLIMNIISTSIALATLCITFAMYIIAQKALTSWRDQKKFELVIEAKANIDICIDLLQKLTDMKFIIDSKKDSIFTSINHVENLQDLIENLRHESIIEIVEAYREFKLKTTQERMLFLRNSSKVTTFTNDTQYLSQELNDLQDFYSELLNAYKIFDTGFDLIEMDLSVPRINTIQDSKEIFNKLIENKIFTFRKKGLELLL